jgi:peptidoglycan/xylan/chitin deacetylase (PgdA/CDA1 family)
MGLRSLAAGVLATSGAVVLLGMPSTETPAALTSALTSLPSSVAELRAPVSPTLVATLPVPARDDDGVARAHFQPEPCAGGEVIYQGASTDRLVALSFDDGPSPTVTPRIVEVLREHGIRATFFVLGEQAERHPEALRALVEGGQELANHGWSHTSFRSLFPSQIEAELDRTADMIEAAGGARPRLVRPPYGRFPESTTALAKARGEDLVLWSVDGGDSVHVDASTIARTVVRDAEPGAIILLHDREPATLHALPLLLAGLARRRLEVVPVSALLGRAATCRSMDTG